MDEDRIDFSSLDPTRDPQRWTRIVASVVTRAHRRRSLPAQLAAWARPTLAAAAACAALAWTAALLDPPARNQPALASSALLSHWSSDTRSAATLQELLGGDDVEP